MGHEVSAVWVQWNRTTSSSSRSRIRHGSTDGRRRTVRVPTRRCTTTTAAYFVGRSRLGLCQVDVDERVVASEVVGRFAQVLGPGDDLTGLIGGFHVYQQRL